jgi:hypothetical protein
MGYCDLVGGRQLGPVFAPDPRMGETEPHEDQLMPSPTDHATQHFSETS